MIRTSLHWATPFSMSVIAASALGAFVGFALMRRAMGAPIALSRRWGLWTIRGLILAVVGVILLNPVRVEEAPGSVERAKVVYLVDTSQSMALGETGKTRWDQVVATIQAAEKSRDVRTGPQLGLFRFGSRLAAIDVPFWKGFEPALAPRGGAGTAVAAEPHPTTEPPPAPTDAETLLSGSLEALSGRFGQTPPQAVVVFSDGRARDPERADAVAAGYRHMKVPIHVVPVGSDLVGGDVAIVSMVAPSLVRKSSQVPVQLFVRSYGYKGKRAELKLVAVGGDGRPGAILGRTPVVLQDGLNSYTLTFPSGEQDRKIAATIDPQVGEVSVRNNTLTADVAIDHTKIRVLYLEGSVENFAVQRGGFLGFGGSTEVRGAYSALQMALMEDPDIECTAVLPSADGDFSSLGRADEKQRGLPETPSELFAYDAIILSNVPREAISDQFLSWIDDWIGRRGGGLCMVGGPNSFGSGRWAGTAVGAMLPVEVVNNGRDWEQPLVSIKPVTDGPLHAILHIAADDAENRALLATVPKFLGRNRVGRVKPTAEVLAWEGTASEARPAIAVQPFGRGRTAALTTGITRRFASEFSQSWGGTDARYYKKFWRNAVYWLTENSSIGRRRLLAETDKRLYRPGEPIVLNAKAFDENAAATLDYRVTVSIEPKSAAESTSDASPLRRPSGARIEAIGGPLLPWGEEFELNKLAGEKSYRSTLAITDAKSLPSGVALTQGLRIELTAYEGNTQVDSTALDVQILDDPSEQQNPLPDHDLLKRLAEASGGTLLHGSADLASMLGRLPISVGPSEVRTMPAWSHGWLMALLIALLTTEWVWRRRVGLA
ncbi:MAG: hypothetical protein JWN86_1604 [Planctomycetota bacterium]|nr:hypothetical protein [Planctomycetota bacterium]